MKCVVIYFSMTGNTEKIARAIHTGVKQSAGHCDIFPVKEANPKRLYEYDLIGLGTPVIGGQWPPLNVEAFLNNMCFVGGKHIFSFCTHNTFWEEYFPTVLPKLKKRGLTVIGWDDWFGSAFSPLGQFTPYPTDGHPDEIDLQEAEAFGREMVWRSQRIYAGETSLIPEVPTMPPDRERLGMPSPDVVRKHWKTFYKESPSRVKYSKEKCLYPECRLCMDNCPMDGIDLSVKPPIIAKPCMTCELCDQICPTGAIHMEEEMAEEQRKADLEINFKDGAIQRCREYEEQGIFRPLIPEDKVGWDKMISKMYNKHPRFVIGKGRPYGIDPWSWRP